jgi:hypothetical protein
MPPIRYTFSGHELILKPPKKVDKMSARLEKLQVEISEQRTVLEKANKDLKILHLSEKKWSWISTAVGVLAFAAPFAKEVSDLVDLQSDDSGCQNSKASIAVGITAGVLAITYICTKTINNCITKKRERLISPLEKQLEELKSLERLFNMMELLSDDEDPPENKDQLLALCAQQMQGQQVSLLSAKKKQQWVYLLMQKLPKESEIKQLMDQAGEMAEGVTPDEGLMQSSPYESMEVSERRHGKENSSETDVEMGKPRHSTSPSVSGDYSGSSGSFAASQASSSPFLSEENADNFAAPPSPKVSRSTLTMSMDDRKRKLQGIAKELKNRLGFDQFYNGKCYFDIKGNVKHC